MYAVFLFFPDQINLDLELDSDLDSNHGAEHLGHLGLSFLTSYNHQLAVKGIAYVRYLKYRISVATVNCPNR